MFPIPRLRAAQKFGFFESTFMIRRITVKVHGSY